MKLQSSTKLKRGYALNHYEIRDFQIIALRWSIAALENLDGITREAVQTDIDCDKELMRKLEQGGTYYDISRIR
jgi:hypothetical protein